jgi:ribosome-binding protein aMBF1 (putative translation factor)
MITGQQIRAARNALRWSVDDLANSADIASKTVRRIEANDGMPDSKLKTISQIKSSLETAGIEFVGTPDDGPGIRIRPAVSKN